MRKDDVIFIKFSFRWIGCAEGSVSLPPKRELELVPDWRFSTRFDERLTSSSFWISWLLQSLKISLFADSISKHGITSCYYRYGCNPEEAGNRW